MNDTNSHVVESCGCGCCAATAAVIEVDARGMEPPRPLITILEAVANLPQGATLRALTDRRPIHLYAQLEQRGFTCKTEETQNGSFITLASRA